MGHPCSCTLSEWLAWAIRETPRASRISNLVASSLDQFCENGWRLLGLPVGGFVMSLSPVDPYAVLGLTPDASPTEITAAYRRAVRACHPDTDRPDPDRLAEVLAAYQFLRGPDRRGTHQQRPSSTHSAGARTIPVRVHRFPPGNGSDLRVGPVRRHPCP